MYKLLLLGTMIGIGVAITKFMKKNKTNNGETTTTNTDQQFTPSAA